MLPITKYVLVFLCSLFFLCAGSHRANAAQSATYEAWYDTLMTVPGQPPQKGKLHTYFDGKSQWSKQEDASGNKSGSVFEIPFDSTLVDYMQLMKGTSLGKKVIDGKSCEGWSFADQLMHRPTVNWIDDSGHLYLQETSKFTGSEGTFVQRRTNQKLNPQVCELTTDPACK